MIKKYLKHEMIRNTVIVLLGGVVAQGIAAVTPIYLTQFFSPSDFGILAIVTAFVSVIGSFSNLDFIATINIADTEEESYQLLKIAQKIGMITVILTTVVILVFNFIPYESKIKSLGLEISLLIPFWVLFYNYFYTSRECLARTGQFKSLSFYNALKALLVSAMQILSGIFFPKVLLLLLSKSIGEMVVAILSFRKVKQHRKTQDTGVEDLRPVFKKYLAITKYTLPTRILDVISKNAIIFALTYFYSLTVVGLYSIAMKLVQLPVTMITENIQKVFEQRSHKYLENNHDLLIYSYRTAILLTAIATPGFLILFFYSEELLSLALNPQWVAAHIYLKWLSPLILFQFLLLPFNSLYRLKRKVSTYFKIESVESFIKYAAIIFCGLRAEELIMIKAYVAVFALFSLFKISYIALELR